MALVVVLVMVVVVVMKLMVLVKSCVALFIRFNLCNNLSARTYKESCAKFRYDLKSIFGQLHASLR